MSTNTLNCNNDQARAALPQVGFVQEGELLVLRLPVRGMPYSMEHIVPSENLERGATAKLSVDAANMLTFFIEPDYLEEPVPLLSEDAAGVLKDAGVFDTIQAVVS